MAGLFCATQFTDIKQKEVGSRKKVSPTICFCTAPGAAYRCVFHLWFISNWPTYFNILLQYAVLWGAFHCCTVVCCFGFFFLPQPADILNFSVSFSDCILYINSNRLLDLSLLFSGFIFYILFPFSLVLSFFISICLLPLSELFQCFLHWLGFLCFSLT